MALLLWAGLNRWDFQKFPSNISYIITELVLKHLDLVLLYESFKLSEHLTSYSKILNVYDLM